MTMHLRAPNKREKHLQTYGRPHKELFPLTHATGRTIDDLIIECNGCSRNIPHEHDIWYVTHWGHTLDIHGLGGCQNCGHGTVIRLRWCADGVLAEWNTERNAWLVYDLFNDFTPAWWDLWGRIRRGWSYACKQLGTRHNG